MAQKIVMSFVLQQILKELGPSISKNQKEKIENRVDSKLAKLLGTDWSNLPVTGPRMMVLVIVLNVILLPFGIAPAVLAEIVITKGKEYHVDKKFITLLETAKGDFSKEKLQEFSKYANKSSKAIKDILSNVISEGFEVSKSIMKQSKNLFENLAIQAKDKIAKKETSSNNDEIESN